jgi:hypothetical protein
MELHGLRSSSLLGAVPGLAEQFKPVPEDYFGWGEDRARITCPCGAASHTVRPARMLGCPCGRVYLLTKSGLRCAAGCSDEEWAEHQAEAA